MKLKLLVVATLFLGINVVHAADSVAIYGLIDLGLTNYSNATTSSGGKASLLRMDSGIAQGTRIGFKGNEDLGGGTSAFFTLETGFNADDGSLGQGGLLFGRQSFVGLNSGELGSVSLGRQYDFMLSLGQYSIGALAPAGAFAWALHADAAHTTAMDDHIWGGDRTNNSIKYNSAKLGGLTVGAMYGFGEVAGSSTASRTVSAATQYDNGGFSTALAYTDIKNSTGVSSSRMFGLGASWLWNAWKPFGVITQVKNTATSSKYTTYEFGTIYALTAMWDLSAAYQIQNRNLGVAGATAFITMADYKISMRTDLYTGLTYNRDKGAKAYAVYAGGVQSGTGLQTAVRIGIRHRF